MHFCLWVLAQSSSPNQFRVSFCMWAGLDRSIFRPPSDSTLTPKGIILSQSLLSAPVIGGRLWLLSRAALPVLNKNFMLCG